MKSLFFLVVLFFLIGSVSAYTADLKIETEYPFTGLIVDVLHFEEGYVVEQFYVETDAFGTAYFDYENDDYNQAGFRVNILEGDETVDAKEFLEPYSFEEGEIVLNLIDPIVVSTNPTIKPRSSDSRGTTSDDSIRNSPVNPAVASDETLSSDSDSLTAMVIHEIMGKPPFAAFVIVSAIFLAWLAWAKRRRY